MEKIHELISERLENKNADLARQQEYFQIMVANEIHTGCFEQNAITTLLAMHQLKGEIRELEHWERVIRATS